MNTYLYIRNTFILIFSLLAGGIISIYLGKELCWDLASYHFYNPFAFWQARESLDFWPTSFIHQYINPTIDFLTYYLITTFTAWNTEFILGAIHGINFWLLFLIATRFLSPSYQASLGAFILAALGMYGPSTYPGIGSFQNDNLITLFVLSYVLLQLKAFDYYILEKKWLHKLFFLAGLLLGVGFGLKLTAAIYVLGGVFANLLLPLTFGERIRLSCFTLIGVCCGFILSAGYWMWIMWEQHANPLFPFFNNIFHSADFPMTNWRDTRFLPQTLSQTLFYPFYFSFDGRTADAPFRDVRFIFVYLLFVILAFRWWRCKIKKPASPQQLLSFWLLNFFIFSYFVWQSYFAIARYLATLEMLAPLVIYLLVTKIINDKWLKNGVLFLLFYSLVFWMVPITMVRAPWFQSSFFNVQLPAIVKSQPRATVLVAYTAFVKDHDPRPQSYLIPYFPAAWHFVGVPFWEGKYWADSKTTNHIKTLIAQRLPLYLLTSDFSMPELYRAAHALGLAPSGNCEKIYSDRQAITHQGVLLCPVKISNPSDRSATPINS